MAGLSERVDFSDYMDKATYAGLTKQVFVPLFAYTTGTEGIWSNPFARELLDATAEKVTAHFICPDDYVSGAKLKVIWIAEAAPGVWKINTDAHWLGDDEAHDAHSDTDINRPIAVSHASDIGIDDTGITFTDLSVGDIIAIELNRDADTTANLSIMGFIFEYVNTG